MARLTIADLQQMKNDGRKIAAGVCYDVQMTRILERAGVDLLSVGDSVSRTFLGMESEDEFSLDAMLLFGRRWVALRSAPSSTWTCRRSSATRGRRRSRKPRAASRRRRART